MKFLRRYSGWASIIAGLMVFFALAKLTGFLLGPVTCRDGWASSSIGRQGACSWHGGVDNSRGFLILIYAAVSGFVGFCVFGKLEPRPQYKQPNPILRQRCPRCGGHMHYDREHEGQARCNRYPICSGEQPALDDRSSSEAVDETTCPQCASPLRLRTAKRGRRSGQQFWGCSQYPRCRGTRPYSANSKE